MSEAKAPKTGDAGSKKPATKTSETKPAGNSSEASSTPAESSPAASTETSASKSGPAGKSASELSISHFSSVSTPAYRSGWDAIFGSGDSGKKTRAKKGNGHDVPDRIAIDDEDIDPDLRTALYKVFQRKARKQGVSLAEIRKKAVLEYSLTCTIREK